MLEIDLDKSVVENSCLRDIWYNIGHEDFIFYAPRAGATTMYLGIYFDLQLRSSCFCGSKQWW